MVPTVCRHMCAGVLYPLSAVLPKDVAKPQQCRVQYCRVPRQRPNWSAWPVIHQRPGSWMDEPPPLSWCLTYPQWQRKPFLKVNLGFQISFLENQRLFFSFTLESRDFYFVSMFCTLLEEPWFSCQWVMSQWYTDIFQDNWQKSPTLTHL